MSANDAAAISANVASGNGSKPQLISVVVPVFNEEKNVERCYAEIRSATAALTDYRFEILFTDNHSTDRTFDILMELAAKDSFVRAVRFSRNFGFHRSVLTGFRLVQGDAAIQIDADLQDPPSLFGPMLAQWRLGHDVVVGVRRSRPEGWLLHWMRKRYYRLLVWLDGPHLIADAGDFRLIDRSVIEKLRHIYDSDPYLRGLISSLAANQVGIPYDRAERQFGESKFPFSRLLKLAANGILTHSNLPLHAVFYFSLLVAIAAMLLSAYYIVARLLFGADWPPGFATTQVLVLFGIGLNGIFVGIIGEYVGRIYNQVRIRPTTVIERALNLSPEALEAGNSQLAWSHPPSVSAGDRSHLA